MRSGFSSVRGMALRLLAGVLLLAAGAHLVAGHGFLKSPISRNYAANLLGQHYCPHCGQGGGQYKTPNICGDPFQDRPSLNYTALFYGIKANLTEAQELDVTITISTNHGGRMALRVCPLDRSQASQDCFNQPQNQLRRVSPDPQYDNKLYWYVPPVSDNTDISARWRLPQGVTCENGCIMQWWWVAYQFCHMPCEAPADDVQTECGRNLVFPVGTCTSVLQTEQFYNCADVIISPGNGNGSPRSPSRPASPSQSPSKPSQPAAIPRQSPPPPPPPSPSPPPPPPRSPARPSSPPSPPGPLCPPSEYDCQQCSSKAADASSALPAMEQPCHVCAATLADGWACYNCLQALLATTNPDVMRGCFQCAASGVNGWACRSVCAARSPDGATMARCTQCYAAATAANNWGCDNCFSATTDTSRLAVCLSCVGGNAEPWSCGECARLHPTACEAQQCAACVAANPGATWGCLVASYAQQCQQQNAIGGRRLRA